MRILCWNPSPKRGHPRSHRSSQWHTRQFHVVQFRGCGSLVNKDTFEPDRQVKSIHIPADKAYCSGWALEAGASKARFRRILGMASPVLQSCHCTATTLWPRGAVLRWMWSAIQEDIDLVAEDFNGASWRCDQQLTVPLKKRAKTPDSLYFPFPHHCGTSVVSQVKWTEECGFVKPPAGTAPSKSIVKSWSSLQKTQTSHHETCAVSVLG